MLVTKNAIKIGGFSAVDTQSLLVVFCGAVAVVTVDELFAVAIGFRGIEFVDIFNKSL